MTLEKFTAKERVTQCESAEKTKGWNRVPRMFYVGIRGMSSFPSTVVRRRLGRYSGASQLDVNAGCHVTRMKGHLCKTSG